MGTKIVKLQPVQGFCAETAGSITLFRATYFGIPVSTTHTITGSIVGVGSAKRFSAVKWGVAGPHRLGVGIDNPDGRPLSPPFCMASFLAFERLTGGCCSSIALGYFKSDPKAQ